MEIGAVPLTRQLKYVQIAEALKADIVAGRLAPNDRLPSFADLRERYGATPATASQAYAVLERERLVTRERGRGVFVGAPRRSRTGIVAVTGGCYARPHLWAYWSSLFQGIEEAAAKAGVEMLFTKLGSETMLSDKIDGVLLSEQFADATSRKLPSGLPCVSLLLPIEGVMSMAVDDYHGVRMAIDHLLALGHRKIAYLCEGYQGYWTRRRLCAYRDGLEEAGIARDARWLRSLPATLPGDCDFRLGGLNAMRTWLRDDWRELGCTALLVHNDDAANGALQALAEAGVHVPRQVSVMGFDGAGTDQMCIPPLTTIQVPLRQIGAAGMELLLRLIRGETPESASGATCTLFPVRLIDRESTAPPN